MKGFESAIVIVAALALGYLLFKHITQPSAGAINLNPTNAYAPGFSQAKSEGYT